MCLRPGELSAYFRQSRYANPNQALDEMDVSNDTKLGLDTHLLATCDTS